MKKAVQELKNKEMGYLKIHQQFRVGTTVKIGKVLEQKDAC
jgi:hypothetical protein